MTDERGTGSGDTGESADDGLDAWLAANFPAKPVEPEPPATPPVQPPPAQPPETPRPAGSESWPPPSPRDQQSSSGVTPPPPELPPVAEELEGIPAAPEFPPPPTEAFVDVAGASGIDALFGDSEFREYEEGFSASENPFARRAPEASPISGAPDGAPRPREGFGKTQKVLLWVAGSLVAALALVVLFMLGTKLPAILGPAPGAVVTPSMTPSPTPTPTVAPIGPVDPGEYLWDELLGGECVDPYDGPWQLRYTVVDCETPHAAQLVTRGVFVPAEGQFGYPGVEELQSQMSLLCTAPDVVDYAAASAYTDIQFESSYALTADDWFDGNRSYNCFLSRSDGGEITGSIAVPQLAPEPTPSEEPAP